MKEHKKYTSIIRYGKTGTREVLKEGDIISITEKLDGANASFIKDEAENMGVSCFSRNNKLYPEKNQNLGGFYQWVEENISPLKDLLIPNYRYFGEWTTKHKVAYKPEYTNQFFLFSIWDEEKQEYLSDAIVRIEAMRLGLRTVDYFYEGAFISYEHLMSFVGKSRMTLAPEAGEGIVVKNVNYRDRNNTQVFVKLVSEKFAELQPQRLPKNPNLGAEHDATILSVLTKPRVEKMLFKLVDDGILDETYGIEDMGTILKHVHSNILEDMLTEESEILQNIEEKTLNKRVGKLTPSIIKEILKEQGRM